MKKTGKWEDAGRFMIIGRDSDAFQMIKRLEKEKAEARRWAGKMLNERNWWRERATEELTRRAVLEVKLALREAKDDCLSTLARRMRESLPRKT